MPTIIPSKARSLLGVQSNVCGFARILKCRSRLLDQHLLSSLLYTVLSSFSIPWHTDMHYRVTIGPIPDPIPFIKLHVPNKSRSVLCRKQHSSLAETISKEHTPYGNNNAGYNATLWLEWTYHVNKRMRDYQQSHLQKLAPLTSWLNTSDVKSCGLPTTVVSASCFLLAFR